MIIILVTCLSDTSSSSDEWESWSKVINAQVKEAGLIIEFEENEQRLVVINGQAFFGGCFPWDRFTQYLETLQKLIDKCKTLRIELGTGDIVAVHYGGDSNYSHEIVKEKYCNGQSLPKALYEPICQTGHTYILIDYSIGVEAGYKREFETFWASPTDANLKAIYARFTSEKEKVRDRSILKDIEALVLKITCFRFYHEALREVKGEIAKSSEISCKLHKILDDMPDVNRSIFGNIVDNINALKNKHDGNSSCSDPDYCLADSEVLVEQLRAIAAKHMG